MLYEFLTEGKSKDSAVLDRGDQRYLSWEFLIIPLISLMPCSTFREMDCIHCKDELSNGLVYYALVVSLRDSYFPVEMRTRPRMPLR